jgi:hypothetical protein
VEKGGGALGGFSCRSGKKGRRNGGGGSRVGVRVGEGEETRGGSGGGQRGRRGTVGTGERRGPLARGSQPTVGGRGEQRGMWAGPGKREMCRARRNRKIFDLFK